MSGKDEDEDDTAFLESLANAVVQNALMNETSDYVARGRRFAELDTDDLNARWVTAFRALFVNHDLHHRHDFDDADAEFRLRQLEPPHDLVRSELAAMAEELRANPTSVDLSQALRDLFRDEDGKN
jgi:hypothetical protein